MQTEARYPALDEGAGHYESFFMKAAAPEGGRALWIRHTIHKRPGQEPTGAVWFTYFDGAAGSPRATKARFGGERLSTPAGRYVRVAEAEIGPEGAAGSISTDALSASWEMRLADRHEPLRHLPSERLYSASLPRTKLLSPHPGTLWTGRLEIDGAELEIASWPGMVGHNWGSEHAERWIWIHGADFEGGAPGDFVDIAAARIKVGPLRTPWLANGMIVLDGVRHRLGGLGRTYGTEIEATPSGCEFVVAGKGINLRGRVGAAAARFVGWIYADPDGGEHNVVNSSIADLELRVERPSRRHAHLALAAGAAYELGMRENDHGVPIQPYPDG